MSFRFIYAIEIVHFACVIRLICSEVDLAWIQCLYTNNRLTKYQLSFILKMKSGSSALITKLYLQVQVLFIPELSKNVRTTYNTIQMFEGHKISIKSKHFFFYCSTFYYKTNMHAHIDTCGDKGENHVLPQKRNQYSLCYLLKKETLMKIGSTLVGHKIW